MTKRLTSFRISRGAPEITLTEDLEALVTASYEDTCTGFLTSLSGSNVGSSICSRVSGTLYICAHAEL